VWGFWVLLSILPLLIAVSIAAHNGRVLTILFTPIAVVLGLYYLRRSATEYISFVVLLFAFSAFVRRVADFFAGYTESSPIVLAPYLVASLAIFVVVRRLHASLRYLSFTLAALAVGYGFTVGAANVGGGSVLKSLLRWSVPLIFGLYCAMEAKREELMNTFLKVTLVCSVIAAAYGIVQFVVAPPWDTAWLTGMQSGGAGISFGSPVPFGIRVFSCLNSPALCASFCSVGLLCSMRLRSGWKYLPMLLLGTALLLTMVRTVWISTSLLMMFLAWQMHGKRALRLFLAVPAIGIVIVAISLPFLNSDFGAKMGDRFSSFGSLDKDDSYRVRRMGMERAVTVITSHPFGEGMGYMESPFFSRSTMATVSSLGAHDIGALEIPFELGYLGTGLYLAGMALALWKMMRRPYSGDETQAVLLSIALNTCLLFASTNPLIAYDGILFWLSAGLLLEGAKEKQVALPEMMPAPAAFARH
jgi:hypothetical protein